MKICENCSCVNDSINRYCRNCGKPFESENTDEIREELPDPAITAGPDETAFDRSDIITEDISEPDVLLTEDTDDFFPIPKAVIDFDFGDEETPESIAEESEIPENNEKRYSTHPVINIMKKVGAGGAFLSVCIFATVLSLAFFAWLYYYDRFVSRPPIAVLLIPLILFTAGSWIYFAACSDTKRNYASTGGLSVIKAASIFCIVICALTEWAAVCGLLLFARFYYNNYDIALFIAGSALFVLAIIYLSKAVSAVSRLQKCARKGTPAKLPLYLIVMNYCFAALASPGIGYFLATERIIELIMTVSFMLIMICLSDAMISYRRQSRRHRRPRDCQNSEKR